MPELFITDHYLLTGGRAKICIILHAALQGEDLAGFNPIVHYKFVRCVRIQIQFPAAEVFAAIRRCLVQKLSRGWLNSVHFILFSATFRIDYAAQLPRLAWVRFIRTTFPHWGHMDGCE